MENPNIHHASCGFPHDNPWNFESPRLQAWIIAKERLFAIAGRLSALVTATTPDDETEAVERRIAAVYAQIDRLWEPRKKGEVPYE